MPIKILLVDDHALFRKGLRLLFEEEQDMSVVGEAADGQEALDQVRQLSPDVIVMDITMPNLNGIEATKRILSQFPGTKIVALSIHKERQFVKDMLEAGATGYILKDSAPEELPDSIRKVIQGEVYLSSVITGVVVSEYVNLLSGSAVTGKELVDSKKGMADTSISMIKTKLYRPQMGTIHLHRQHLLDRLNMRLHRPLTLVCAPAGYGKSTLVSCWLEVCDLPAAWLSLDDSDNDLHLFLSYVLAAVQTVFPEAGQEIQAILKAPELPPMDVLRSLIVNELDKIDKPFILVIDDYHVVLNKVIHELLGEILKHPPHAMHLVLVSRVDPPLSVASLRAKGQMSEFRVNDLCFSHTEIAEFLKQILGTPIEEKIVSIFEKKSEGWVTGLRLAALSLRHTDNIESTAVSLQDANSYILDYFVEEILTKQPKAMQDYWLSTSILDRFCAPLCDAVFISDTASGAEDINGQNFIQLLKKDNLFIISLDDEGRWFRYHHLFQNLLKQRSKLRFKPEDIGVLHTNASIWFAKTGHFEEAIQHALAGGNVDGAVKIVGDARYDLMNRDEWPRLVQWLKLFSHEAVQKYLHLILLRCWINLYHWYRLDYLVKDLEQADLLLETSGLNTHEVGSLKAEVAAMRSNFAYWTLNPSDGVVMAEQALRDSPDGHECTQSTALLGWGALCQMLGKIKQGERILWEHMKDGRFNHPSSQTRLMQSLCLAYWPESEIRKLRQAASRLLQLSLEYDLTWNQSFARYFLGLIHYERNELDEAVAQFEIIVGQPHHFPIQNLVHCSFLLSLSYQALGLPDQACKVVEEIKKLTFELGNQMFIDLAEAFQADLDLRQGRIAQSNQWARAFVVPAPHGMQRFFNAELTFIKILIARNTPQSLKSAAAQLDSMHKLMGEIHHLRLMIDVLGMQALLADALSQESTAFEKLSKALTLAEPGAFIRPFLDLGNQMGNLLKRLREQKTDIKHIEQILIAFNNEETGKGADVPDDQNVHRSYLSNQVLVDPLTKREIEILLVLSKNLSNPEIAKELFISPETVKRHLYNIYQKIGVENRKQAIAKAKSLRIL
jgi:LuxR family maltose regulon positive regulatory protein